MGYDAVVDEVTELFRSGRKDAAAEAIPDEMVTETMIVGNRDEVRDGVRRWRMRGG